MNWNSVLNDLNYLASHAYDLRRRLPGINVEELLGIRGDLGVLLQDLAPYDSETDPNRVEQL